MKFNYEHDGLDGLVLIDEYYFNEINDDILYSFDIFLDSKGITELIYDFPGEKWEVVRARESVAFKEFCNSGKMIVWLANKSIVNCEIDFIDGECDAHMFLNVPSGKLALVNASELIQRVPYPESEMEKILEINVEKGTYAVKNEGIKKISCYKNVSKNLVANNFQEL